MANYPNDTTRRRPSRLWYALALVLLLGSAAVFVTVLSDRRTSMQSGIEAMPRFVAPSGESGTVVDIDEPGKYHIFHENLGTYNGREYESPRRQVWTTFGSPSMTCEIERVDSPGKKIEVRLSGVGEKIDKRKVTEDLVYPYDFDGRQGSSIWVFDVEEAGAYRIKLSYVDAVNEDPDSIEVLPGLTEAEKKKMQSTDGAAYEKARRDAEEQRVLAALEPVPVLIAVGTDPTGGELFEVLGLKGAATVFAFGFTAAVLITLVTLMLRGGHVTPRGEMSEVRRMADRM